MMQIMQRAHLIVTKVGVRKVFGQQVMSMDMLQEELTRLGMLSAEEVELADQREREERNE